MKKSNKVINLGCRLNIYEGEIIKDHITNYKLENLTIINSCAVTAQAEKKVNYEIRKAKKNNPYNKIVVTGCAAQINPKKYESLKEVDLVVGNKEKLLNNTWDQIDFSKTIQVDNIMNEISVTNSSIEKFDGKSRAYIEIQQGCDHRCTFCIIPYGRGNNRSVPAGDIINRIKKIVCNGYKEVVLTGVDITDYGKNLPGKPTLSNLIKRILKLVPELKQLRLSSIDCAEINDEFWPLLSEEKLMPHFHLSLQSGSNLILKRMKRRHTREQAIQFCNKVLSLRKDATFGADIIAGFPTETEDMFKETMKLIDECNLTHLHVFPYSPRDKTPAALMPQVENVLIRNRAKKLRDKGNVMLSKHLIKKVGKKSMLLIEKNEGNISNGKDQYFIKVELNEKVGEGNIVPCIYTGIQNNVLLAKRI